MGLSLQRTREETERPEKELPQSVQRPVPLCSTQEGSTLSLGLCTSCVRLKFTLKVRYMFTSEITKKQNVLFSLQNHAFTSLMLPYVYSSVI